VSFDQNLKVPTAAGTRPAVCSTSVRTALHNRTEWPACCQSTLHRTAQHYCVTCMLSVRTALHCTTLLCDLHVVSPHCTALHNITVWPACCQSALHCTALHNITVWPACCQSALHCTTLHDITVWPACCQSALHCTARHYSVTCMLLRSSCSSVHRLTTGVRLSSWFPPTVCTLRVSTPWGHRSHLSTIPRRN
jgi:hypothetical protein